MGSTVTTTPSAMTFLHNLTHTTRILRFCYFMSYSTGHYSAGEGK